MFDMTSPGQTPLDEEERAGLKLAIYTREELDRAEFESIANAEIWAVRRLRFRLRWRTPLRTLMSGSRSSARAG